jgi:prepilin-type N-terminal cleavage/methylation domain-containing protein
MKNIKKRIIPTIQMTPQSNLKSRPFTLLEVVIVLALIGMMAVFGTWSLTDLLAQHRRGSEIDELQNFLQELQIEALALRSDFEVTFSKSEDKLSVRSKTAEKILRDRTVVLKGLREFKFKNEPKAKATFQILSTGRIDPPGIIEIERNKGSLWIDMRQPLQIKFFDKQPSLLHEVIPDKPKQKEITYAADKPSV